MASPDRDRAEAAATKAATIMLSLYPNIASMLKKAKARDDGKVPPGSSEVTRDYSDTRFLLCQIFIQKGKFKEIHGNFSAAKEDYREALVCFPKSVEANLLLAKIVKAVATTTEGLKAVEKLLRKAIAASKTLGPVPVQDDEDKSLSTIIKNEEDAGTEATEALHLFLCQEARFQVRKCLRYNHTIP